MTEQKTARFHGAIDGLERMAHIEDEARKSLINRAERETAIGWVRAHITIDGRTCVWRLNDQRISRAALIEAFKVSA